MCAMLNRKDAGRNLMTLFFIARSPLPLLNSYLSWDDYFMALAFLSAQRSKDPSKQVGACIVSPARIILGIGYNGFPRGCADSRLPWAKRATSGGALATKYPYVCHAEMNAILNKNAANVAAATLYVTMFPCNECSKLLIQAGIREVVFYEVRVCVALVVSCEWRAVCVFACTHPAPFPISPRTNKPAASPPARPPAGASCRPNRTQRRARCWTWLACARASTRQRRR